MTSKDIFEAIKDFRRATDDLYESSSKYENKVYAVAKKSLNNEHIESHFSGLEPQNYTDYDKAVLNLIAEIMFATKDSNIEKSYIKVRTQYEQLLNVLKKD